MKMYAVLGAVLASATLFAGPAVANKIPKPFQCIPIEGNTSPAYDKTCEIWVTNGEFAGDCGCKEGFALYDPLNTILKIPDDNTPDTDGKASGS